MAKKKHYIDKLIDAVADAAQDGVLFQRRERLRDDVVGLIEREKDEAVKDVKAKLAEAQKVNGQLRLELRDASNDADVSSDDD